MLRAAESDLIAASFRHPGRSLEACCEMGGPYMKFGIISIGVSNMVGSIDHVMRCRNYTLDVDNVAFESNLLHEDEFAAAGGLARIEHCYGRRNFVGGDPVDIAVAVATLADQRHALGQLVWPHSLYRWYDSNGVLLYIGISDDVASRHNAHLKRSIWSQFAVTSTVERYCSRDLLERAEKHFIRYRGPIFNKQHNGGPESRERAVKYLAELGRFDLLTPSAPVPIAPTYEPSESTKKLAHEALETALSHRS